MSEKLRGYRRFTKEEVEFNRISYADYLLKRGLLDWKMGNTKSNIGKGDKE